jgi:hypothetical protein
MASFGQPKHKQKNLEFAQQHFGTQSSLWVKINFDPMVRWGGLNKINIHTVYWFSIYNFSMATRPHVCDSWNITKQKEIEKIMQSPSIKSRSGSGFS